MTPPSDNQQPAASSGTPVCKKCGAIMSELPKDRFSSAFTVTGFKCDKCGHWNNLKRRKKR